MSAWYLGKEVNKCGVGIAARDRILVDTGDPLQLLVVQAAWLEQVEDIEEHVKADPDLCSAAKGRYSPAECIGARKETIEGNPDPAYISTSYAERQNLNVRMHTRRFTRLTNAFSKKVKPREFRGPVCDVLQFRPQP